MSLFPDTYNIIISQINIVFILQILWQSSNLGDRIYYNKSINLSNIAFFGSVSRGILMNEKIPERKKSRFDTLISSLINYEDKGQENLIDLLCRPGVQLKAIKSVPLRFRLIAYGFYNKLSLEELNQKLNENGQLGLYSRSLSEATVIYAFSRGLSYYEWANLRDKSYHLYNQCLTEDNSLHNFHITMQDIDQYVENNSVLDNDSIRRTKHFTQILEKKIIEEADKEQQNFLTFLKTNIEYYTSVREKTRYYFCKYLLYYLNKKMDDYLQVLETGLNYELEDARNEIVSKSKTDFKRKKQTLDGARENIYKNSISFSMIFKEYNNFYFGFINKDWFSVIIDYYIFEYKNLTNLHPTQKKQIADELRKRNKKLMNLSDDDVITWLIEDNEKKEKELDEQYSPENTKKNYQKGRSGENFLRNVCRGNLDLDRITFISFLIFFGQEAQNQIPDNQKITEKRINEILLECGFQTLTTNEYPAENNSFDQFVIDFLNADDPKALLQEEAETLSFNEENFYLYKTYLNSYSIEDAWKLITD